MTAYEAYHCAVCGDTGERSNESRNIVNPAKTVECFCAGLGVVLVLTGFTPPWYAGLRWPDRDLPAHATTTSAKP